MMYYLDTSAIVKIYIQESGSDWTQKLRDRSQKGEVFICEISGAEVFAAFHRRFRTGNLPADKLREICDLFREDYEKFFLSLPVIKTVVNTGMQLIQKYPLRGYDSIQLATAVSFLNELQTLNGEFLYFVGADKILNDAAKGENLMVINPSEQE